MKVITMVYTKTIFVQDRWAVLVPKMVHILINSKIFFIKILQNEGPDRYIKILLVVFRQQNSFGAI